MSEIQDVVILGSGCAGNTAAIYSARANLAPLVYEGHEPGGQLSITTDVENFPGFPEGIMGPGLVENMKQQAQRFGAVYRHGRVVHADLSKRPFTLTFDHDEVVQTRTLIVATGASARWLNLPNEQKLIGHGVSSCATCDGFFFKNRKIMVIGGGDSAMEEANFLREVGIPTTDYTFSDGSGLSRLTLVAPRAVTALLVLPMPGVVTVMLFAPSGALPAINRVAVICVNVATGVPTTVMPVGRFSVPKNEVTGVKLRNVKTNEVYDREVAGFFVAIGHIPNTLPFASQLHLDPDGYIVSHGGARTNIEGVFHAGDVQDRTYRQAITASGAGCMAAIEAERLLEAEGH